MEKDKQQPLRTEEIEENYDSLWRKLEKQEKCIGCKSHLCKSDFIKDDCKPAGRQQINMYCGATTNNITFS